MTAIPWLDYPPPYLVNRHLIEVAAGLPFDPADLDTLPPDDIDTCTNCAGSGVVLAYLDADTGNAVDKPCPRCSGTGETYGWLA